MAEGTGALKREMAAMMEVIRAQAKQIDRLERALLVVSSPTFDINSEELIEIRTDQNQKKSVGSFLKDLRNQPEAETLDLSYDPNKVAKAV